MENIKLNNTIKEYLLYNMTGTSVFIICQMVYLFLLLQLNVPYVISSATCTFVAAIIGYFLNSYITFKNKSFSILKLVKIILMQFFQSIPNFIILVVVVEMFHIPKSIAPMIPPMIMTPIMFIFSKRILK